MCRRTRRGRRCLPGEGDFACWAGGSADDVPGLDEPGLVVVGEGVVSEHFPVGLYGFLFEYGEVTVWDCDPLLRHDDEIWAAVLSRRSCWWGI